MQISAGKSIHTCALKLNGEALCWGKGETGRLGNDGTADKDYPVAVLDEGEGAGTLNLGTFHRGFYCDDEGCALDSVTLSSVETYPHVVEVSGGGESEVTLYQDVDCTNSIGSVTGSGEIALPSLSDGFRPFFFKQGEGRCSSSFLVYDLDQTPPENFAGSIPVEKTVEPGGVPATVQVDGLAEGESFTLYSDSACTLALSESIAASGEAMQVAGCCS